eukprot:TRINITY_DN1956_c0_g1_i1.p2 TRINITY_DN1956_c0_g1~~TRINITY_DN1956_c0_g1_i1.p2  ORF type:complete len:214 (-),score=29.29 TRINITY_DN1956_c0_g1_i1:1086-1691(-)
MKPFVLAFACIFVLFAQVYAVNIYVPPNQESCFFEDVQRGEKVVTSFNVASGGFLDVDVKMYGPDNKVIFDAEREKEGSFQFMALQSGMHRLCFGNTMSTVTGKTVSFHIYVGHSLIEKNTIKTEHLTVVENGVVLLSEGVNAVKDSVEYTKIRERICRLTIDNTNSRVLWWSLVRTAMLIGVALYQIYYLRQLFETKMTR